MNDMTPVRWTPNRDRQMPPWPVPSWGQALGRGAMGRCPCCGTTHLFHGYLRVVDDCSNCGAPLGSVRADDAPPYFTILIVGHIVIPGMYMLERAYSPSFAVQAVLWLSVTTILCLGLLRPIKGATVGLMLKLGMFKSETDD